MRLFWALPCLDPQVLLAAQRSLKQRGVVGRWVDPGLAHLTLVFLGEVEAARLEAIRQAGHCAALDQSPIALQTNGFGAFPRPSAARTLWWGLEESRELSNLAHRLHLAMRPFADLEERAFRPHLTLARFSRPSQMPDLGAPTPYSWIADTAILYRSQLGPVVRHEPLTEVKFSRPGSTPLG